MRRIQYNVVYFSVADPELLLHTQTGFLKAKNVIKIQNTKIPCFLQECLRKPGSATVLFVRAYSFFTSFVCRLTQPCSTFFNHGMAPYCVPVIGCWALNNQPVKTTSTYFLSSFPLYCMISLMVFFVLSRHFLVFPRVSLFAKTT